MTAFVRIFVDCLLYSIDAHTNQFPRLIITGAACSCDSKVIEILLTNDDPDWKDRLETRVTISKEECPSGGCRPLDLYQKHHLCEPVFGSDIWNKQCHVNKDTSDRLDPSKSQQKSFQHSIGNNVTAEAR